MAKSLYIREWMEFRDLDIKEMSSKLHLSKKDTDKVISDLENVERSKITDLTDTTSDDGIIRKELCNPNSFHILKKIAEILYAETKDLLIDPNHAYIFKDVLYYKDNKFYKHYGSCVDNYIDLRLPQIYTTDHKFAIRLQRWFKNHNIKNEIYAIITPTHITKKGCELFVILYESAPLSLFTQLKIRMSIIHSDVREKFRTGHRYDGMSLINLQGCDIDGDVRSFHKSEHHIL